MVAGKSGLNSRFLIVVVVKWEYGSGASRRFCE